MYERIAANRWKSVLLVALVLGLAAAIGWLIGALFAWGIAGVVLALAIAVIMSLVSYLAGDRVVLAVSGARPSTPQEHPRLHNIVDGLCIAAGMPKPRVHVIPEAAMNAFATGRKPETASIAVTQGLLDGLSRVELEGVVAHELSHVKNRDVLFGTLVATLVGVVVLLAGFLRRGFLWGGMRVRGRLAPIGVLLVLFGLLFSLLAPLAAHLIRLAVSRRREYLADADGALMTRYPPGLASALRKIAEGPNQMRAANNATAHLWFSQPSAVPGDGVSRLERLFSTHPPIPDRIKALQDM
ncbi:MAG: M48 family metallopeptidase [Actinomycetota bacterium]|nr:M48 family metallopeptidase [Actinomycetota bacterium]